MSELDFKIITICKNPMEVEIYPAALREKDVPHRTEWGAGGTLTIMVPAEWEAEAIQALDHAARVFFKEEFQPAAGENSQEKPATTENETQSPLQEPAEVHEGEAEADEAEEGQAADESGSSPDKGPSGEVEPKGENSSASAEANEEMNFGRWSMFDRDGLPSPEETKIRAVWPAWVLAALPGAGLGHLYAGKFQMFLYLVFMSVLGFMFYDYTKSIFAFLLNLFAWSMDLGFAAYHIKEHNRKARRNQKRMKEAEKQFYDTL
jgi:hypothetical protein